MPTMGKAVLIIDDDMQEAEALRQVLNSSGMHAFIAGSEMAVSRLLAVYPFALAITKPARWDRIPLHPLQAYIRHNIPEYKVTAFGTDLPAGELPEQIRQGRSLRAMPRQARHA